MFANFHFIHASYDSFPYVFIFNRSWQSVKLLPLFRSFYEISKINLYNDK